jgi:hypothetical protein
VSQQQATKQTVCLCEPWEVLLMQINLTKREIIIIADSLKLSKSKALKSVHKHFETQDRIDCLETAKEIDAVYIKMLKRKNDPRWGK